MVKSKFIIGAFYTTNTVYVDIVQKYLIPSIERFNLDCDIIPVQRKGSWLDNVALKPSIILKLLHEYKDRTLVFLDADCTIEQYPILFDSVSDYDIGFHMLDWRTWYNYPDSTTKELLTGTMFFNYSDALVTLIEHWIDDLKINNIWEQKSLQQVIKKFAPMLKIYELPLEYCYIKTLPSGQVPNVKCDPIILHHQVSRQTKRILK